jgi:hypothetical protein
MIGKGAIMPRIGLLSGQLDREQDISVAEVLVRHRILQDTIVVYGLTMAIVALVCGAFIYSFL